MSSTNGLAKQQERVNHNGSSSGLSRKEIYLLSRLVQMPQEYKAMEREGQPIPKSITTGNVRVRRYAQKTYISSRSIVR